MHYMDAHTRINQQALGQVSGVSPAAASVSVGLGDCSLPADCPRRFSSPESLYTHMCHVIVPECMLPFH